MAETKHKITSFEDLCNLVNDDNVEVLAEDLKSWLIAYNSIIKEIKESSEIDTYGLSNTDIATSGFTWYDDGKNDLKGITINDPDGVHRLEVEINKIDIEE